MTVARLPAPPFGNAATACDFSVNSLRNAIESAAPGHFHLEDRSGDRVFAHRSSVARCGSLSIVASATTPIFVKRDRMPYASIRIPAAGNCRHRIGGRRYEERAGQSAVFLSGAPREHHTAEGYISLMLALDNNRLTDTAAAMLGPDKSVDASRLGLDEDREIPLQIAGISFADTLRHHLGIIDALASHASALDLLGLDDTFYRSFAMMLRPDLFFGADALAAATRGGSDRRVVERTCEYMRARLDQRITISDLERFSGLSARTLQYAFQRHLQCSSKEWLMRERLNLAHNRLRTATPGMSVLSIALDCGFTNPGRFASQYRQRFGGSPSEALARALMS